MAEPSTVPDSRRHRRKPPKILILFAIVAVAIVAWLLLRDDGDNEPRFTGYVVSDNIYMASPIAGTLAWVGIERGSNVMPGTALFRIDPTGLEARAEQARAGVSASEADIRERQANLARARANLAAAEADANRTKIELARLSGADRDKAGSVSGLQLDQAGAAYRAATERRNAARNEMAAIAATIAAGHAQIVRDRAGVVEAERDLSELSPASPARGRVEDVMYQTGEWVTANAPVVSIVPDAKVKVRFYVPETLVASYRTGTRVAIACDGCPAGMSATVDYVAPRPEYTPPVIYSLETRDKLVFLIEAVPSNPRRLVPGQPMDVTALRDRSR